MNEGILKYVLLPNETTAIELAHVRRINGVALWACVAHLPLFVFVAWLCSTSIAQAIGFGTLLVLGPVVATLTLKNPRTLSLVFGFTSMGLGALLVHLGQGPMQIEMHFHFFAALALLTVWGNPLIIWVATLTVAAHHGLFYFLLPRSVFNYEASIWVVVVHAAFVVVEAIAASFIARNFFDNVIGLEKIVQAKTAEIQRRNEDMKTILNNTAQGFMTVGMDGTIEPERSTILASWLGDTSTSLFSVIGRLSKEFAQGLELGWEGIKEDIMPLEVTLDQLPKSLRLGALTLGFEYRPIMANGKVDKVLVVVSDLTAQVERDRAEREQKETMAVFEKINRDRHGFFEFVDEGDRLVQSISGGRGLGEPELWRTVHTLKGTSGLFGVASVADLCHQIEDEMAEDKSGVRQESREKLIAAWTSLRERLRPFAGDGRQVHVGESDLVDALARVKKGASREELVQLITSWRYEPLKVRFGRFAEQAEAIAERLGKGEVEVRVEDHGLRLPQARWAPFWASFSHAIRNAVDHGIETGEERAANGKTKAVITYSAKIAGETLVLTIEDNGRGINWERVKAKARSRGLPSKTEADLVEAIFADGFSTKDEAAAVSGRGVGMGSLRAECRRLGGTVNLASELGRGTRVSFIFPLAAMLDKGDSRAAAA